MSKMTDQGYLLSEQYRDASNLDARRQLHRRFSTNKYGWTRWVFDQFNFPARSRILELGCGPANLWAENLDRMPGGWEVILSDLSAGMVEKAQWNLSRSERRFEYKVIDAQEIPYEDASFDGVIANHMLYHVPDIEAALSEIRRVMKVGGRFYATTVGEGHMRELAEMVRRCIGDDEVWQDQLPEAFLLQNGYERLRKWFAEVKLRRYEDELTVTEAEPLVAYVESMIVGAVLGGEKLRAFKKFVEQELKRQKAIYIAKDSGIFESVRVRRTRQRISR